MLTTARQAWVLAVVLAAIYDYVTGTGIVDMVAQVAIQGAVIYLVLAIGRGSRLASKARS